MKIRFYLATAIVALSWMGCSQEEATNEIMNGANVIQATIESTSRSAVTDAGVFSWTSGDQISLLDANNKDTYTYSGTGNGFNPPTPKVVTTPVVAYYPANESHTTTKFYLPATYGDVNTDYVANTHAAMIATPPADGNTYAFMHLGGVMRFNIKNVPAGADGFKFRVVGKKITGEFEVKSGTTKTIETDDAPSTGNTVIIWFKKLTEAKDMTFYVPMPTGTYGDYYVGLHIDGQNEFNEHHSTDVTNTIARKTLLLMPTFTWNGTTLEKGEATVGVIDLEDGSKSATIEDDAEVVVTPGTDADATATLNYTPADDGSSALSISDGSGATQSGDSEGKVLVSTANSSTVASCDINTPSLTVELSAADNGTATYNEVTALTANQTLIIGEGVTIKKLILKGGNVELYGKVEKISSEVPTTIKLMKDIDLTSEWQIEEDMNVTLDLNGYTLAVDYETNHGIDNYGTLNIKGNNGKITWVATNYGDNAVYCIVNRTGATMTIDACEVGGPVYNYGDMTVGNGSNLITDAAERGALLCGSDTKHIAWTFTMTGGSIISKQHSAAVLKKNYIGLDSPGLGKFSGVAFEGTTFHDIVLWEANIDWDDCTLVRNNVWLDADENISYVNGNPTKKENLQPCKWEEMFNAPVTSLDALAAAITNTPADGTPTTILLDGNIDVTQELTIASGQNITLDLNGNTLAVNYETNHGIDNYGTLNIKGNNGKITWVATNYGDNAVYCIVNRTGATMTIDACEVGGPVYNYGDMTVGNGSNLITDAAERGALLCGSDTKHIAWTFTMTGGSIISKQHSAAVLKKNYIDLDSPGLGKFSGVTFEGTTFHDIVLWEANIEWDDCTLVRNNVWLDADENISYVNGNPTKKENLQPCKWEDIFPAVNE